MQEVPRTKDPLAALDEELSEELKAIEPEVLAVASQIQGRKVSIHSLHGTIGGKNNLYVDAVREEFSNPEQFFAAWLAGLGQQIRSTLSSQARYGNAYDTAAMRIGRMLKEPVVLDYARTYFARNFYRNFRERTRYKPIEELWSVWFGANQHVWGLLLAPVLREGEWTNDKSEIRRANYDYWTVQHALTTGFIVPDSRRPTTFTGVNQLLAFYEGVLKRASASQYEKAIADRYLSYIENSPRPTSEPLLIPEIRYEGKQVTHKYRLDFSVLNSHTRRFSGFELSPASTHMSIEKIRKADLTKVATDEYLAGKWEKEMDKRNAYFQRYGIHTLTFTDARLADIDGCFTDIEVALSDRPTEEITEAIELAKLLAMIP